MAIPDPPEYTHGSQGTPPSSSLDYLNSDAVDPEHFDYYWYTLFYYANELIDALEAIDSNDDGKVDAADTADDAKNITDTINGIDYDDDSDGTLDEADEVLGLGGALHGAGGLPKFADESTGLNNTSEGDVFYNQNTNSFVENTG
jgi:hypothetical protein